MNEAKRKKILYVVLALAVVWGGWQFTHPRQRYQPGTQAVTTSTPAIDSATAAPAMVNIDSKRAESWGRDPFRSRRSAENTDFQEAVEIISDEGASSSSGWSLTGIMYHGVNPMAFINGRMVRVGDFIDHARVVSIDKAKVTLSVNGTQLELFVNKG